MIEFIDEEGMIAPIGIDGLNADVAVTAFSAHIFDELLKYTDARFFKVACGSIEVPVYVSEKFGKRLAIYRSPIGAAPAASALEEVMAAGVKKVVAFGICGALVPTPPHTFMVPTRAYRDEGTSYHYAPASDYMELKNSAAVAQSLQDHGVGVLNGGTWCTDGFFRETKTRADTMRANGCIAVDMESAALQAVADFRGKQFYTFFISADSLAGEVWEPNDVLELKVTQPTTLAVEEAVKLALDI